MKIKKIHIENYRILKSIVIDLEDDLSLVIGKNNCGKTSFLSILNKFIGLKSSKNYFTYDDFNNDFQDDLFKAVQNGSGSYEKLIKKGIELFLYIEFNENDNLSNIQPLMFDLDPKNNTVVLKFEYTISEQKFETLCSDISNFWNKLEVDKKEGKKTFEAFIRNNHKNYFEIIKKAVSYDVQTETASEEIYRILGANDIDIKKIICFRCIKAKRDIENKENDNTLSSLSRLYYDKAKSENGEDLEVKLEKEMFEADKSFSNLYGDLFKPVMEKIRKFGGVNEETKIQIISSLSKQHLLKDNAMVVYENDQHELPESYNGLGYLNLINIIFDIEIYLNDFLKISNKEEKPADINFLFIEEPEAHTHPQLQYVFIKNIKKLLKDGAKGNPKKKINLQTVITSHSPQIVSECDFDDIKYFRKVPNESVQSKNLKDLEVAYKNETGQEKYQSRFKFLKQYLTLNYAEIFFADKAILYEGETERILLPAMLKKIDEEDKSTTDLPLLSQNISLVASGAYSQIFDEFLSFIGIKTLIITDIDSAITKKDPNSGMTITEACEVSKATTTTNGSLKHYFKNEYSKANPSNEIEFFTKLKSEDKVLKKENGLWSKNPDGNLRIAFQTKEDNYYYPRSFEDAFFQINRDFIFNNLEKFESLKNKKKFVNVKDSNGQYKSDSYTLAKECIGSKASFALDVLLNSNYQENSSFSNWNIPPYIKEGLLWLKKN